MSDQKTFTENITGFFLKTIKNRNILIFLIFFAIASFLWFLNAINKEYTTEFEIPFNFKNLPENIDLTAESENDLTISVQGHGYNLLREEIERIKIPVIFDFETKNNPIVFHKLTNDIKLSYVLTVDLSPFISKRFGNNIKVVGIKPDTLFFNSGKTYSKKVPIIPNIKFEIDNNYILNGNVSLTPDSLTVYGPKEIIDTIQNVYTEKKDIGIIDDNSIGEIKVLYLKHLSYSKAKVLINVPVEKYTEASQEIDIRAKNFPDSLNAVIMPAKVIVSYKVPLSIYDDITIEDFTAVADYTKNQNENIEVDVVSLNEKIEIINFQPITVKYLLKKNEE